MLDDCLGNGCVAPAIAVACAALQRILPCQGDVDRGAALVPLWEAYHAKACALYDRGRSSRTPDHVRHAGPVRVRVRV